MDENKITLIVEVNDLSQHTELARFGEIAYVDEMMDFIFIHTSKFSIPKIQNLSFVLSTEVSSNFALQSV